MVFHVFAKATGVASTSPLITLKSSVRMLLKFPHRPGGWTDRCHQHKMGMRLRRGGEVEGEREGDGVDREVGQGRTARGALEGGAGGDVELHVGNELHLQLQTHGGLDEDEEGGGLEDAHIRCSTGRGP